MTGKDPDAVPAWRRYLRFWRTDATGDVRDELDFHLESAVDELMAAGLSPDAAREQARRKFGDVDSIHETLRNLSQERERHMTRAHWLDAFRHDVAFGLRQLRKSPSFTAIALATLALGIGANSAIFSVVYSVLLQPLPYANADRIMRLGQRNGADEVWWIPFGNYEAWRTQTTAFEAVGAIWGQGTATLTGRGEPTAVRAAFASAGYWKAEFIPPVLGRYFTEAEDRFGGPPVVVISSALWQAQFAGDPNIIGKAITLRSKPYTIVGVAPSSYLTGPPFEAVWTPLAPEPERLTDYGDHELTIYGLLKPGVTPATAIRQIQAIETPLAKEHPHNRYDGGAAVRPLIDDMVGDQRARLYTLLGAVTLVLLIACGNIANLLLARATVRRGEIAIRGALGATRGRIITQMLAESLLLAAGGAVLGLAVAFVGMRFLVSAPAQIPRLHSTSLNGPVVAFTIVVAIVCAFVFGLFPALRAARLDLQQTLRDAGRESVHGRERLRWVLIVAELCVAQVLLVGAGLLIRSSIELDAVPIGFDTHNLLMASIGLPSSRYPTADQVETGFQRMETAIAAIPGVTSVGRTQTAPIYSGGWDWTAQREGSDGHDEGAVGSDMRFVGPSYFSTLGLRLLRGRDFARGDTRDAPPVAIISRGLGKRLFGDADPVGRRISNSGGKTWMEIVGVVNDMHADGVKAEPPLELYMPTMQRGNPYYTFLVRAGVPVATLVPAVRRAVGSVDPLVSLGGVSTMDAALEKTLAMDHFTKWLFVLLGATGLVLAIVGVYGVVSYFVTQRTHELGIRLALGASAAELRWLVVKQGVTLGAVGVVLGAGVSFGVSRVIRAMLFGVTPHDPATFGAVAVLLVIVALAASYIPARRATRIDPLEALRSS